MIKIMKFGSYFVQQLSSRSLVVSPDHEMRNLLSVSTLLGPKNEEPGMGDQDGDYHERKCGFHETDKADPVAP